MRKPYGGEIVRGGFCDSRFTRRGRRPLMLSEEYLWPSGRTVRVIQICHSGRRVVKILTRIITACHFGVYDL
jgi:hypothetical protein